MQSQLRNLSASLAIVAALSFGGPAQSAVLVNGPLPTNAYITFNGLDWAWANPWPYTDPNAQWDLSVQAAFGWRIPTLAELALAPAAAQFAFAGANVPLGGSDPVSGAVFQAGSPGQDAACATPYFSNRTWCDWQDGRGGALGWDWYGSPANVQNGFPYDTIVVRNGVPEPAALALFGLGLAGLGFSRRKKA